ncbi:MAG: histidine phosphatase family protein, partial [Actinoplanes sp.]
GGRNAALALPRPPGPWVCAPTRAARQTVAALGGSDPLEDGRLSDPDYGSWTGRPIGEVSLGDWLTNPAAVPHGGESLIAVIARAGEWLDEHAGRTVAAVAHPTVVRAALCHALALPADGIWRLDVAPLAVCRLTHRAGRWHLSL